MGNHCAECVFNVLMSHLWVEDDNWLSEQVHDLFRETVTGPINSCKADDISWTRKMCHPLVHIPPAFLGQLENALQAIQHLHHGLGVSSLSACIVQRCLSRIMLFSCRQNAY